MCSGNRLIDCIPCTNLPDGAVWTTQDIEPKNDSFSRVWKVSANCDWVCKQVSCSPCVRLYSISCFWDSGVQRCSEPSGKTIQLRATITIHYCTVTLTPCLFLPYNLTVPRFGDTLFLASPPPRLSTNPDLCACLLSYSE